MMKHEVEVFNFQIRGDAERQALLQAVKDRVFGRIDIVVAFTTAVFKPQIRDQPEELQRATEEVVS